MPNEKWNVDHAHSSIDFSVKHMMISKVKGSFPDFEASIEADPNDLTTAHIEFNIDVASIDTGNKDRDDHLRSADFFEVEKFPKITFKSKNIVKKADGEYDLTGDLTIRDTTKEETFKVTFGGQVKSPVTEKQVAAFNAEGTINRKDYGLSWNAPLETGGVLVGEDIKVSIELEAEKV